MVYIFMGLVTLIVFGLTASDSVNIAGSSNNVYKNAPYVISFLTLIFTIFGLLSATAFYNRAALKDFDNGFNEILFSAPISKSGYFFGRFSSALLLSTMPLLGVFIGVYLASVISPVLDWTDADKYGDFYIETFVINYLLFILPNMFIVGSMIFALAIKWKSTSISFIGTLVIFVLYTISGTLMDDIDNESIAALLDMFGGSTFEIATKYYTAVEQNTLSPIIDNLMLYNRIIWISIGVIILAISYKTFSFQAKTKKAHTKDEEQVSEQNVFALPELNLDFNMKTSLIQFKSFFTVNFISIVKGTTFKVLFVFGTIMLISTLYGGFEYYGLKSYPLTYKLIDAISASSMTFATILLVFYGGELIWRDRNSKIYEVVDATPHLSYISLSAKALSLVSVVSILNIFFIVLSIIYQLINGYTRIELDIYILDFVMSNLPFYFIISGLMIMIQVLVNNKYLGYFVSLIVLFGSKILFSILDISSRMLSIASRPNTMYSDISGFGPGVYGKLWFNVYWILFSIVTILIAGFIWNRGVKTSLKVRIMNSLNITAKNYKIATVIVTLIWIGVASFVHYNTQILNETISSDVREELRVDYEKKYKGYEKLPLPKIIDVRYFVDIFPKERDVRIKAILKLKNETTTPIDSIFYSIDDDWSPEFKIPNSELTLNDVNLGFRVYRLRNPLQLNDTLEIEIKTEYVTKGFVNGRENTSILENGSFFNNMNILPILGYLSSVEINDRFKRKEHGLSPKDRMPKLDSTNIEGRMVNYLTGGHSDYINVETVISTSLDQTAIAPGSLVKEWKKDGRNFYKYRVDHTSQNFYSFVSGRYEVATRKWNDVDIEVYYDEKHSVNVDMMMNAVERSLDYYTKNFGTYYHKQCRIIEFPRYSTFAQAFPGTMPYSESFGFIINLEDESENNIIDAVIAHEMSHQWWAHQVIGANMQGGTMLSESFAEYSSLMTMKSIVENPMKMRKFLKYNHDSYLHGRGGETKEELPLYKVENQQYIHYKKGSVILYALQDYIGEDKVNIAMRNFLEEFKYKAPPYPTSLDFLKHLEPQVPDSLKYLINDWFKEITLYDNRLKETNYEKLESGKYQVTIDVESFKIKADSLGNETNVNINDWVDIGVFSDDDEEKLMYQKRVKIDKPEMTFSFVVDSLPVKAAIDPRHLLIDRVYKDNIKVIKEKE
ncbi:MAG: M1 family aminopeptidase [Bacteroidota bacterium]